MPRISKTALVLLVLLVAAPLTGAYPLLLMKVMCYALLACAFNLLLGFGGLMSFGHAMFFGTAGYAAGHAMKVWGLTPELGLLAGTVAAAALGLVTGALAIRRQGIYFAMITMALAQMVFFVLLQAPFTAGEDGLQGVPRGRLFGLLPLANDLVLYYVVTAVFLAAFVMIERVVRSPFGQVLKAIRDNEPRAVSLGYDADRFKLLVFVLSAALAGLAGAMKTLVLGFASLSDAHWSTSGDVVLMTLMGGVGTLLGPVVGSALTVLLQSALIDRIGGWVTVIMGLLFMVCVLAFRKGIVGELASWSWPSRRRTAVPESKVQLAAPQVHPPIPR